MTTTTSLPRRHSGDALREQRQGIADEIKELTQRWVSNTFEIGKKLKELRDTFPVSNKSKYGPRPGWHECIEKEFQFSHQWATNAINAYEKFGASTEVEALPAKVILLLSAPSVPETAVQEVVQEAKSGKKVSAKRAKQIVTKHTPQKQTGKKRQRSQPSRSATAASVPGSLTESVPLQFSPQPAREPEQAPADVGHQAEDDNPSELPDLIRELFGIDSDPGTPKSTLWQRIEALTHDDPHRVTAKVIEALQAHHRVTAELISLLQTSSAQDVLH
jgi:hypothetical protein